jgi:hypothetical protein
LDKKLEQVLVRILASVWTVDGEEGIRNADISFSFDSTRGYLLSCAELAALPIV